MIEALHELYQVAMHQMIHWGTKLSFLQIPVTLDLAAASIRPPCDFGCKPASTLHVSAGTMVKSPCKAITYGFCI